MNYDDRVEVDDLNEWIQQRFNSKVCLAPLIVQLIKSSALFLSLLYSNSNIQILIYVCQLNQLPCTVFSIGNRIILYSQETNASEGTTESDESEANDDEKSEVVDDSEG